MQISKQPQSLSRKIGIAFAVSFAVGVGLSLSLAIAAAPMGLLALLLSGAASAIPSIFVDILLNVLLPIATLCAIGIGTASSIVLWIFHRSTPAQTEPTLAQLACCDFEEVPRKPTRRAFVPDAGTLLVLLGIGAAAIYLERPPIAYQYWQNFQLIPWLVCACIAFGTMLVVLHGHRIRLHLPTAWWRLRAVLIALAAVLAFNGIVAWRSETSRCSPNVLEALLDAGNVDDLKTYARAHCNSEALGRIRARIIDQLLGRTTYSAQIRYESSDWQDLLHLLSILGMGTYDGSGRDSAGSSSTAAKLDKATLLSALSAVLDAGARVRGQDWEALMGADADHVRDQVVEIYRRAPESAGAWSADVLGELIADLAARNKIDELRYLIAQGLRFDAGWNEFSFLLIDTALYNKSPYWNFYDELVAAGLMVPPKLLRLLTAIRSKELSGLSDWSADDWQGPASGVVENRYSYNHSLQFAAALYSEDTMVRAELLRLSGVDEQTLIERTPLPKRCILAKRFGVDRIRETLPAAPEESFNVERCEGIFWTVMHKYD